MRRGLHMGSVLIALMLGHVWAIAAQEPAAPARKGTRVAVINVRRIVQESIPGQRMSREIQAFQQKQLQELRKLENELQQLQKQYQEQAAVLSQEALQSLRSKIRAKTRQIERFREDADAELQDRISAALTRLENEVRPIILDVCREKGIDIVLDAQFVIFFSSAVDITEDVIRRFNEKATGAQGSTNPP